MRSASRGSLLLAVVTLVLLLSGDVVDAKKKKKKMKKKHKQDVKSTANIPHEEHLTAIADSLAECREGEGKESKKACLLDSIDKLDKLIIQHPQTPEFWLQRGRYKLEKEFYPGAEKDFDRVIELDSDFEGLAKWATLDKAEVYKKKKLFAKGLQTLTALAEELDTPFLEGNVRRCEFLAMLGEWDAAKQMCSSVIDSPTDLEREWFDGGLGWVYFYRGQAHEKLLEMKEALEDYNESLDSWSYIPDVTTANIHDHTQTQRQVRTVHFQRADLLCAGFCGGEQIGAMRSQLGASIDLDGAIADYSFVIDSPLTYPGTTNHAVTSARRGMAFLKQEKDAEALQDFTNAVESESGKTEAGWILNRGLCHARLGDWKEAIKDYTSAITITPANPTALTNRGIIYQRRKMWETAIEDFAKAEVAADNSAAKGDALTHKAFCLMRLGKKKKALKAIEVACHTHKTTYACEYDGEDEIEKLDMNAAVGELPDEEEALEGTGDAEDETWIPFQALVRPEKVERGAKVTVGDFNQLKKAWEEYDEWSEDYAWQEGESAYIVDLDEADGTVLLKFVEEAPEIKEKEEDKPKITFQTAPIKHIKQKTLAPFKKKFSQSFMFFYRASSLCGHCAAVKPTFAQVAEYIMERNALKDFSVGGIDCSQKGAPTELCDGVHEVHPGVDGSAAGSKNAPRVIYFNGDWGEKGENGVPYVDMMALGEHPGQMRKWLHEQGVEAASVTAEKVDSVGEF